MFYKVVCCDYMANKEILASETAQETALQPPALKVLPPVQLVLYPNVNALANLARALNTNGEGSYRDVPAANLQLALASRSQEIRALHEAWPPVPAFLDMLGTLAVETKPGGAVVKVSTRVSI